MMLNILIKNLYKNKVYSNHTNYSNLYVSLNDLINVGWVHQATKFFLNPRMTVGTSLVCFSNIEVLGHAFVIS